MQSSCAQNRIRNLVSSVQSVACKALDDAIGQNSIGENQASTILWLLHQPVHQLRLRIAND